MLSVFSSYGGDLALIWWVGSPRRWFGVGGCLGLLLCLVVVAPAWGADEDDDVYSDDPLGLVAGYNVTTYYSLDEDVWDVWICEVPEGRFDISADKTVQLLETKLAPYFVQLSGGRYRPTFRVGGVIEVEAFDNWGGCDRAVHEAAGQLDQNKRPEGVIIIVNKPTWASYGSIGGVGYPSPVEVSLGDTTYPDNLRSLYIGGEAVVDSSNLPDDVFFDSELPPILSIVAHEMGHAIGFPHSFRFEEYDDPMDVMSQNESVSSLQLGTITFNRYAAGWIDPSDVAVYARGTEQYTLALPGAKGKQMLVVRGEDSGFITLGVRVRVGADVGILKEGVESYYIDQQPTFCHSYPDYRACFGTSRLTRALADPSQPLIVETGDTTAHILEVGDGYVWDNISIRIIDRKENNFIVEVSDSSAKAEQVLSAKKDRAAVDARPRNEVLYREDPLGLIVAYDAHTYYTLGDDVFEVWACETPQGLVDLDVEKIVGLLRKELVPYFEWLSGGRYRPVFRAGGTIELDSFTNLYDCEEAAADRSKGGAEGGIIIGDYVEEVSIASPGFMTIVSPTEIAHHAKTYPDSQRSVFLGIHTVAEPGSLSSERTSRYETPVLATAAHEIGHALGFPHSYRFYPYDHEMDIMGNSEEIGRIQVGTIAINRYAAGWIDTDEVEIYSSGKKTYTLQPLGTKGTQMLVLKTEKSGYVTLGARVSKGYDAGIPKEGVESYYVDQEDPRCIYGADDYQGCYVTGRPTRALIYADPTDPVEHVTGVGGSYTWEGISVSVVDRIGDSFLVQVDDGSEETAAEHAGVHQPAIDALTKRYPGLFSGTGCESGLCPREPLQRWEMAVWMVRVVDQATPQTAEQFDDVDDDAWWAPYTGRLAELGITTGCATEPLRFCPNKPVTRAQMATFLVRALNLQPGPSAGFADTSGTHEQNINAIAAAGITTGCQTGPPRYCPNKPVTRAQMATFLARAQELI